MAMLRVFILFLLISCLVLSVEGRKKKRRCTLSTTASRKKCTSASGRLCNGQGGCLCGKCRCKWGYSGPTCELCPAARRDSCPSTCDNLKSCVECRVWQTGPYNRQSCRRVCYHLRLSIVDELPVYHHAASTHVCQFKDKHNCAYSFAYEVYASKNVIVKRVTECPN
ncbi:integrin beta-1-B-like [Tubulanus polymorphus]|uniref:integrin beta-1-B-like n=1 Tax=Tubulanus polymorphus TaxID=672921 RepID=UPI003DA20430